MTHPLPTPKELKAMFARAKRGYRKAKQAAEASVVRWVWSTGETRSLRPGYDGLIDGWPVGKELSAPPKKRDGMYEYGLDADGRLAVVRLHQKSAKHFGERFFDYHDGWAEEWGYGPDPEDKDVETVGVHVFDRGRPVGYAGRYYDDRTQTEKFTYDAAGRLKTLRRVETEPDYAATFEHTYDDVGLRSIKMSVDGDRSEVVYERPTRTPAALQKAVRARLLELIPERVAALKPKAPAFALALVYDPGSALSMLPPKLAVGVEPEREGWRKRGGDKASLWDAQSFASFDADALDLDDPALLADTRELAQHLRTDAGMTAAHKLLVDLAKDLNKVDFGIAVTPDFVVYPVDLHTEHLAQDLAAVVPAAKLKRLKARGEI